MGQLWGKVSASPQRVWSRQLARVVPASWQMIAYPLRTWQRSSSCALGSRATHRSNTQCLEKQWGRWGLSGEEETGTPGPAEEGLEAPAERHQAVRVWVCACCAYTRACIGGGCHKELRPWRSEPNSTNRRQAAGPREKQFPMSRAPDSLLEGLWVHSLVTGSKGALGVHQHPTGLGAIDEL